MTSRPNDSPGTNCQTRSDGRSDQESSTKVEEEGCPVIEESGAVCGETRTLSIFQEFRQIYNECMRRMESNKEDNLALRKLAPFRKLVEDLWEQNVMLVETVEELEQEATSRVASLQNKLDQCSDKVAEKLNDMNTLVNAYLEDIDALVEVIRRFRENGKLDSTGLKFNTVCEFEIHGIHDKRRCMKECEETASEVVTSASEQEAWAEGRNGSVTATDSAPTIKASETSRSISCQSDLSPSSHCSEFFDKAEKLAGTGGGGSIGNGGSSGNGTPSCVCSDCLNLASEQPCNVGEEVAEVTDTDSGECKQFSLWKIQTIEETDENAESFHSAVDCSKIAEKSDTASKSERMQQAGLPTVSENPEELNEPKSSAVDTTAANKEIVCEEKCSNCTRPININLNFISDYVQHHSRDCDCDCTYCGC